VMITRLRMTGLLILWLERDSALELAAFD
jgi:hypothetical protein